MRTLEELFFRRDMGLRLTSVPLGAVVATARLAGVFKVTQNPRLAGISGWEPDYSRVLATNRLSTPEHREIEIDPWGDFTTRKSGT